jgi:hypothetical protein
MKLIRYILQKYTNFEGIVYTNFLGVVAKLDAFFSASARISKRQGYQGFLRKRAGSSLGQKGQFASYKEKLEKWTEFHYF